MPGLDRSIVEHRLPIKPGFRPYKQPPRKIYKDEVLADVKKEVEMLIEAIFIRTCRYVEWISNIVPVYKKNEKMRVCIDFRDLNRATPMDGYLLIVKIRQPSHEFTFGVGISFIPYPLVLTPVV
jgi:hypothetical protein